MTFPDRLRSAARFLRHHRARHPARPPRRAATALPEPADFAARYRRAEAALPRLGDAALAVDDMLSAARWLDSFARGEDGHAGLGPAAAPWLAARAADALSAAEDLAAALTAALTRAVAGLAAGGGDGAR